MPYSIPKHFWTWFQRHSDTLLNVYKTDKKEEEYWMREIDIHLRAHSKKLSFLVTWHTKGGATFTITACKRSRYFNMAEKFAAKAPELPGWQIFALQPPNLAPQEFFEQLALKAGIDLQKCWFIPPREKTADGKIVLHIFVEVYTEITEEMCKAIDAAICNMLGEKTVGLEIGDMVLYSLFDRSEAQKKKQLIPLHRLPAYVLSRDTANVRVNEKGQLLCE